MQRNASSKIPATFFDRGAGAFWLSIVAIGIATGLGAALLTRLLEFIQHVVWSGSGTDILAAASGAPAIRHIYALVGAGLATGLGQIILVQLTSGNGIDISEAIWFYAGRLPALRTLGSALLSVIIVGMGCSLGREGAPKQTGAVIANFLCDRKGFSDDVRKLLVACGAGAGLAAAYGVPLGGSLFALEVLRGVLALRLIVPALATCVIATMVSWVALPNMPTYMIPSFPLSYSVVVWSVLAAPLIGLASVGYVRLIAYADQHKPKKWIRLVAPLLALSLVGVASIWFPQILGNGKDVAEKVFTTSLPITLLLALAVLKPAATALCLGSGAPGGLFTPSLSFGALLGAVLGAAWSYLWPGVPQGFFALIGAAGMLAATTQGPVSAIVLLFELTNRDRSFIIPVLITVGIATLTARSIEARSIYDARLSDAQVRERLKARNRVLED